MISRPKSGAVTSWKAGSRELRQIVERWLATPDEFDTRVLSQSRYRRVVRLASTELDAPIAIKEFLPAQSRRTALKRVTSRLKHLARRSAPQLEWTALAKLSIAGLPVSPPLAFGWRNNGAALIVTRYVADAKTLGDALSGYAFERHRLLRQVGALVHQLHQRGYLHGDLHIGNILVGEKGPVLVDLQRVREIKHPDDCVRDLAFLDFSLHHLGVTRSNRLRFRIAALGLGEFRVAHQRQLLRDIGRASSARGVEYYAARTRRTLRVGEGNSQVAFEGWTGLRQNVFPEAAVRAAVTAHQRLVDDRADAMIKFDHRSHVSAIEIENVRVVIKQVVKTSVRKQLADLIRGSAARRAWVGGLGLQLRGIEAATPFAFLETQRHGVPVKSMVLLEDFSQYPRVSDIVPGGPYVDDLPRLLLDLLLRLHRNQVVHADLQSIHIYLKDVNGNVNPALIDLEGVRFSRQLGDEERIQMLAQLNASIGEEVISTDARAEMMSRYSRALPFERGNEWARKRVVKQSIARDQRWKGSC